jgi:hypothetical protein
MSEWRNPVRFCRLLCLLAAAGLAVVTAVGAGAPKSRAAVRADKVDFRKHIQPLLQTYCYDCHDDQKHKGGLSLEVFTDVEKIRAHRDSPAQRRVHTAAREANLSLPK